MSYVVLKAMFGHFMGKLTPRKLPKPKLSQPTKSSSAKSKG